ncbi:internal head protein [Pseudomonas phage D6]|nr:internal head protein [Pseudomonas phage D6]
MSLNLSAYIPSNENFDEAIPSPLMDGDIPAIAETPVDDLGDVQVVDDVAALPVEQAVELPPELDPTPLQPLEAPIIQEEVLAENADAEAGQLLGAQIALEGYSKLLRSSGKNMTRQSAAFMAVGMRRASRMLGDVSFGLENESSGTQVMAMQKAQVDEKGIGTKLKEIGNKIWEWLKKKVGQLRDWFKSLGNAKKKDAVVYLIAASEAVASGNPAKVKGLPAPSGLTVSQVLDAIHGEDVRAPAPQKRVSVPANLAVVVSRGGKLDLSMAAENKLRNEGLVQYITDATAMVTQLTAMFQQKRDGVNEEEIQDSVADVIRKTMGGKPGKWEIHGAVVTRSQDGVLDIEINEDSADTEVELPTPQDLRKFMEDVKQAIDSEDPKAVAVAEKFAAAGEKMVETGDNGTNHLSPEQQEAMANAIVRVLKGYEIENRVIAVGQYLDKLSTRAIKATDFFLSVHLGKGNTVSQEDFEALPSRALTVVGGQQASKPGLLQRAGAAGKEAWRKVKEFFQRIWAQFTEWAKNLWKRVFGVEQSTDVLLLTNDAVPEDGRPAGALPQLPNGTRLKSVQAARSLGGPSADGTPPPAPTEMPAGSSFQVNEPAPVEPSVQKGFVYVPEAGEIMVGGDIALDPVWEEAMTNWLIRHYIPTQEKVVRDLTSYAGSATFDDGIMGFSQVIEKAVPQLFQGMPTQNVPGQRQIAPGEGCKIRVSQEGMMGEVPPVKIAKKRQIDQALARQKKLLKALGGLEKSRVALDRQRTQLNAILDRRVESGVPEESVTHFYNAMERTVIVSSATVIASVITKMCAARVAACDAMIAARARGQA